MFFEKTECLASTYKSGGLNDKLPKMTIYINEFISYLNQYCEIIFFSQILANNNLPLKINCESIAKTFVIKIDTDFNLNILLKLFFFSPILKFIVKIL